MKLFTAAQMKQLLKNGTGAERGKDHFPVVKLFTPDAQGTWLLIDIDPEDTNQAFGLCDVGHPELGYVSLAELAAFRGPFRLPIERDRHFEAIHPISVYAQAARVHGSITTIGRHLEEAAAYLKAHRKE